jgi:Aspartyl protease/PDZ domain
MPLPDLTDVWFCFTSCFHRKSSLAIASLLICPLASFAQGSTSPIHQTDHTDASRILKRFSEMTHADALMGLEECTSVGRLTVAGKSGPLIYQENLRTGDNVSGLSIPALSVMQRQGNETSTGWQQDAAGDIMLSPASDPTSVDDRYITRRAYLGANYGSATITLLPTTNTTNSWNRLFVKVQGGSGFTLWFNRGTGLLDQISGSVSKKFSDYRNVGGVMLPFVETKANGPQTIRLVYTRRVLRSTLRQRDFRIPFQNDYAMPKEGFVTIAARKGLEFETRVNKRGPFTCVLDTGSVNIMSADFARRLGLSVRQSKRSLATSTKTSIGASTVRVRTLQIGRLILYNQLFYVIDVSDKGSGPRLALGYPLLRRFAITLDHEHNRITIQDAPKFTYHGRGTSVPLQIVGSNILVEASIGIAHGSFVVDSGNSFGSFTIEAFTKAYELNKMLSARFTAYAGRGYGGSSSSAYVVRVDNFHIGRVNVPSIILDLGIDPSDQRPYAGNIGQNVLDRFTEVLDCMRGVMYFESTSQSVEPQVFNRAGVVFDINTEGKLVIATVLPGSPASTAHLRVGDVIIAIDGTAPPPELNPPVFLRPPGSSISITVARSGHRGPLIIPLTLHDVL